jgi:competence protein ComFC
VGLLDLLLPHRCPVCAEPGPSPCPPCIDGLPPPPALPPPPGLDACHAAVAYRDGGRAIVAALKFAGARGSVGWVAAELAGRVDRAGLHRVTWVPTTAAHRRRRGADQAEVLAAAVARHLGLPCQGLLVRLAGPPQAGRGAAARRLGPPLAPRPGRITGGVLVVDDVITSGGSVAAAARALRSAGAAEVVAAAAARTPPPRRRGDHRP